ncbi:MAG: DHH family phosphoesterase, partial [Nanoarchaeota archaeon]|nr:DHH family phosphoesterase [Nanoarchaeota archaeon]
MILITGYENPDLDVTACAYGYAELLRHQGKKAEAGLFGTPQREAEFALNHFHVSIPNGEDIIAKADAIVLVDTSHLNDVPESIPIEKVIEIIDHRLINDAEKFPNAKCQIEAVGSCATLIAERFQEENATPSEIAAGMLYSAIISNTVNFMAGTTTERDRKMATWLLEHVRLSKAYIHDMFKYKSNFTKPIKEILLDDSTTREVGGKTTNILQLEIVDVEEVVKEREEELKRIVREVKEETNVDVA